MQGRPRGLILFYVHFMMKEADHEAHIFSIHSFCFFESCLIACVGKLCCIANCCPQWSLQFGLDPLLKHYHSVSSHLCLTGYYVYTFICNGSTTSIFGVIDQRALLLYWFLVSSSDFMLIPINPFPKHFFSNSIRSF